MHNGNIGGFDKIRRSVLATMKDWSFNYAISNSCSDTALAFAVFLDQLDAPNQQVCARREAPTLDDADVATASRPSARFLLRELLQSLSCRSAIPVAPSHDAQHF
jgi:hypothetical protein